MYEYIYDILKSKCSKGDLNLFFNRFCYVKYSHNINQMDYSRVFNNYKIENDVNMCM